MNAGRGCFGRREKNEDLEKNKSLPFNVCTGKEIMSRKKKRDGQCSRVSNDKEGERVSE